MIATKPPRTPSFDLSARTIKTTPPRHAGQLSLLLLLVVVVVVVVVVV